MTIEYKSAIGHIHDLMDIWDLSLLTAFFDKSYRDLRKAEIIVCFFLSQNKVEKSPPRPPRVPKWGVNWATRMPNHGNDPRIILDLNLRPCRHRSEPFLCIIEMHPLWTHDPSSPYCCLQKIKAGSSPNSQSDKPSIIGKLSSLSVRSVPPLQAKKKTIVFNKLVFFFLLKNHACDAQSRGFNAGGRLTPIIGRSSSPDECPNVKILHYIFTFCFLANFFDQKRNLFQ